MRGKLIYLPNWVGDFLMAWASLKHCLREDVFFFGKPRFRELVEEVVPQDMWISKSGSFVGDWITLFKSRAVEAILLPNSFSSALLTTLAGMKTIGVVSDARGFLLNKRIKTGAVHQAEVYRQVLIAAGFSLPEVLAGSLHLSEKNIHWAKAELSRLGVDREALFAVHPGASKPQRCWKVEGFAEVCKRLIRMGYFILIVGGVGDSKQAAALEGMLPEGYCLNMAKLNLSLGRLAALISLAKGFLGNDSGPLHIAAAAGVPCVGIYGTSVPERTGPVVAPGTPFEAVCSRYPCSPCRERFFKDCDPVDGSPPCIASIGVDEVWEAVESVLT